MSFPLGPKEEFYREHARDAWRPLTERREVKQAVTVLFLGLFAVIGGGFALVLTHDFTPFVAGIGFVAWSVSTLWAYRVPFAAWRTIGGVHLEFHDGALSVGEPGIIELVVIPRRDLTIASASLTLWAFDSRGGRVMPPFSTGVAFDAAPSPVAATKGVELRLPVDVTLDPAAPSSRFDQGFQLQWRALARLSTSDGRVWEREYPVLVYPGVSTAWVSTTP